MKNRILSAVLLLAFVIIGCCSCGGSGLEVKSPGTTPPSSLAPGISSAGTPGETSGAQQVQSSTVPSVVFVSTLPSGTTPAPVSSSSQPASTSSELPEKQETARVSMLAAGDNLLHKDVLIDANLRAADGEYFNFDPIYRFVKGQISAADYSVINQETLAFSMKKMSGGVNAFINSKLFNNGSGSFISPGQIIDALARAGFDGIGMANNHMLDAGSAPIHWSLQYIEGIQGLTAFGGYRSEADMSDIRVVEKNGIRIALLAYTYATELSVDIAKRDDPSTDFAIPVISDARILSDLAAAEEKADFSLVFIHWGEEESTTDPKFSPTDEQRRLAKLMAENGADIIIGHHSHALQPIEYVEDGKGGRVLCAYSLGTLVSNMKDAWNVLAGFLTFDIVKWDDGTVTVENAGFDPTVCYYNREHREYALYYLKNFTKELAESHGITNGSMTVEKLYGYLKKAIAPEFLSSDYKN